MSKTTKNNFITYGIVIAFYIVMQILTGAGVVSNLVKGLFVPICVYSMLAVSLNLTVGVLGELSLGHAGFMCLGAFSGAFFSKCFAGTMPDLVCFICAILVGAAVAAIGGVLIGIPVLRLRGDYLAIVTLAFGEIIMNIMGVLYIGKDKNGIQFDMNMGETIELAEDGEMILSGPMGIMGTPRYANFTIGIILLILSLIIVLNLINSRTGRAVMAIRDDRIAAESTGVNITKYKLMAFTVSAMIAGAAGVLYAHNYYILQPSPINFGYNMSIMILVYVVLGGIGRIRGSVIAATVLVALPELLRLIGMDQYRMLIYAVLLIAIMIYNWSPKALEWREKHSFVKKKGDNNNANKQ